MNLSLLQTKVNDLEKEVNSLQGQCILLTDQYNKTEIQLLELKKLQIVNQKAIEFLNLIQKTTKELISNMFESIISKALVYIHQNNNYQFKLDFEQRGNLPTLNFNVKTPDMQEAHDILDTRGGGSIDIVSLALRLVLLEISKTPGFVFFDEIFKHLDSPETLKKAIEFVKEIQKDTKRQIFMISHEQEMVDSVLNPIIITNEQKIDVTKEQIKKVDTIVKKRGRPKGVKA